MIRIPRRLALALGPVLALLLTAAAAAQAPADPSQVGDGRRLDPAGRQTEVGAFPTGGALSPDGRFYWAVDAGRGQTAVRVVDVGTGAVRQTLPIPGGYVGVAFAPGGRRAYVSGQRADGKAQPGIKGADGDVIHVFDVDPGSGAATELDPLALPDARDGAAAGDELPPASGVQAWPEGLAVTPDGKQLVVALGQADQVAIYDLASGRSQLVDVGRYPYGVAVDPRRPRAYVTNERDGTVSVLDLAAGRVLATIDVGGPRGAAYAHPEGIAADPVRDRVYVAVTDRDLVAVIDSGAAKLERLVDVGRPPAIGTAPVAVSPSPDGRTLFVADANEDALTAVALTDRPGAAPGPGATGPLGRPHRVIRRPSLAAVARYRRLAARARHARTTRGRRTRKLRRLRARYLRGRSTTACAGPTPAQVRRYAGALLRGLEARAAARKGALGTSRAARRRRAAADRRYRALTRTQRGRLPVIRRCAAPVPGTGGGAGSGARAFDIIGRLPTAAYPTDVEVTPDGKRLVWLAAKGYGTGPSTTDDDISKLLRGRVGVLPTPSDSELAGLTQRVDRQVVPVNTTAPPPGTPVVGPGGGPSDKIKHVFYVVRENRTYDQIFGSEPGGRGDARLQLFDDNGVPGPTGGVTPNAHALARRFGLLDAVYANSEESTAGHKITAGGYANDYTQRYTNASRGRKGNPDIFPIGIPPNAFVFDQAVRQSVPFRVYGELGAGNQPFSDDGRPTYDGVQTNTDPSYPSQVQGTCRPAVPVPAGTPLAARCTTDAGEVASAAGTTSGAPATSSRIRTFASRFEQQVASGTVPTLSYLILFNDHTDGTAPGVYTPKADIADNDLALGQLVELVSQSSIWKDSAILVLEDDSQAGADSVDAHRMPAFVISPWARRGGVVSTRYDSYSFLRTAELITGLKPLSLNDALATPLYDAFVSGDQGPDVEGTRYRAIQPQQSLTETNPADAPNARLSAALPWDKADTVPQSLSDRILWQSVFGAASDPPPPGPNASGLERERAREALDAFSAGRDVRRLLLRTAEDEPGG